MAVDHDAVADLSAAVTDAVARLGAAAHPLDALGREVHPGALAARLGRRLRIEPAGEAWRLGTLLLTPAGALAVAGRVVRAQEEVRRGHTAESSRERADLGAAAVRGGIAAGRLVHLDLTALDPAAPVPPLVVDAQGRILLTWAIGATPVPLAAHLRERVTLVLETSGER